MTSLILTDVELIEHEDLIVYWLGDDTKEDQIGVAFRPCVANIANQGAAESVALSLSLANDMVDQSTTTDAEYQRGYKAGFDRVTDEAKPYLDNLKAQVAEWESLYAKASKANVSLCEENRTLRERLASDLVALDRWKLAVVEADSELSAYAAGRPLDKETALRVSGVCRAAYKEIVDKMLGRGEAAEAAGGASG
jgi:hypothetical protein